MEASLRSQPSCGIVSGEPEEEWCIVMPRDSHARRGEAKGRMTSLLEKGGGTFAGIKMLLCENPLPPLDDAVTAAQEELARSNYYTEAHSAGRRSQSEQ